MSTINSRNARLAAADGELMDRIFGDGAANEVSGLFNEYDRTREELAQPAFVKTEFTAATLHVLHAVDHLTDAQKLAVLTGAIVGVSSKGSPPIKQRAVEITEITLNALNDIIVADAGGMVDKEGLHVASVHRLSGHAGFDSSVNVVG